MLKEAKFLRMAAAIASALSLSAKSEAAQSVTLAWNRAESHGPEITFELLWGLSSRKYTERGDAGTNLTYTVGNLTEGATYYFAAIAKNPEGLMSEYSDEVNYTVPRLGPKLTIQRSLLSTVTLTVKGKEGERFVIESSASPNGPDWALAFEGIVPASGEVTFMEASSLSSRFYRARKAI